MLQSITISNFRSYGNPTTIDFRANKSNLLRSSLHCDLRNKNQPRITKFNIMFGPNGSGKSNLIAAISFFRYVITKKMPQKGISNLANAFHKKTLGDIGSFETEFFISAIRDLITYKIRVNYSKHIIIEESLSIGKDEIFCWKINNEGFPDVKLKVKIFTAKDDRDYVIHRCDEYESIKDPNESLLAHLSATRKDKSKVNVVDRYFRSILDVFYHIVIFSPYPNSYEDLKDVYTNESPVAEKMMTDLKELGIPAKRIKLESMSKEDFADEIGISTARLEELATILQKDLSPGETKHFILLDRPYYYGMKDGEIVYYKIVLEYDKSVVLSFDDESSGNQKIINLIPSLLRDENQDETLFLIDEIDSSLHTILVKKLMEKIVNKNSDTNRQFFFTAHDPNLLDTQLFRKDELFFLDMINHESKIERLDQKGIRIDRDIRKKFINGAMQSSHL